MVKNLPAMQETWVQSLGQEDLLEEENSMERGSWQATVHGVTKGGAQLINLQVHTHSRATASIAVAKQSKEAPSLNTESILEPKSASLG